MRQGYTLAELLVALAILGVMAAAAVPALGVWLDGEPAPAERVAGLLRDARSVALRSARPVEVTLSPATGQWVLAREDSALIEGMLRLDGVVLADGDTPIVVRFEPTGGAAGSPVPVREGGRVAVVRADRWTGEVSIDGP